MKTCPNCGKEVMEDFDTCFHCGEELLIRKRETYRNHQQGMSDQVFLFYILALFFPLIGLIIALGVRRKDRELARKVLLVIYVSFVFYAIMVAIPAMFLIL